MADNRSMGEAEPDDASLIHPDDDAVTIRKKILKYLQTRLASYIGGNLRFGIIWNFVSLLVIILSTLTAILAAINNDYLKVYIIILPAVSALLSTILLQFRVRDLWQLRDEGRIEIELLICRAHLITTDDRGAALQAAMELRTAGISLERDQSHRFFSVLGQPSSTPLQHAPSDSMVGHAPSHIAEKPKEDHGMVQKP